MNIISIHIFPHEICGYERVMKILTQSLTYIDKLDNIEIWSVLNKNPQLTDWDSTPNLNEKITEKFINLNKSIPIKTIYDVTTSKEMWGVNEHRRTTIANADPDDTIIFLDCDLYFNEKLLVNQLISVSSIINLTDYYIVSPQIIRLWDSTWDCLVHSKYKKHTYNFHKTADAETIVNTDYGAPFLTKNKTNEAFKWGGGWYNAISANLLKYTGLPTSFVGYGPDDTYVMYCCQLMRRANKNVQQYILNNMIVVEGISPTHESAKLKKNIPNFREDCNHHFSSELNKFKQKL